MHDPNLPSIVTTLRAVPCGPVLVVVVDPVEDPPHGLRCDAAALRAAVPRGPERWVLFAPSPQPVSAHWLGAALMLVHRERGVMVVSAGAVTDAVKEVDTHGRVVATVDRSTLAWAVAPALVPRDAVRALPRTGVVEPLACGLTVRVVHT